MKLFLLYLYSPFYYLSLIRFSLIFLNNGTPNIPGLGNPSSYELPSCKLQDVEITVWLPIRYKSIANKSIVNVPRHSYLATTDNVVIE